MNTIVRAKDLHRSLPNFEATSGSKTFLKSPQDGKEWLFDFILPPPSGALEDSNRSVETNLRKTFVENSPRPKPLEPPKPLIEEDRDNTRVGGSFYAIQEWEGYIYRIADGKIFANLLDLIEPAERPQEKAEIPIEEIPENELECITIGAVFRLSLGYYRRFSGQKDRMSRIRFRRLPRWLRTAESVINQEADDLVEFFSTAAKDAPSKI